MVSMVERTLAYALAEHREAEAIWEDSIDLGIEPTLYMHREFLALEGNTNWKMHWRQHIAETMVLRQDMHSIYDLLSEHVGRVLILKGEPMAVQLYDNSYARRSGDVDVLCAPEDVERIWHVLTERGYRGLYDEKPRPWLYNQWAVAQGQGQRVIEVHWKLSAPEIGEPSFDDLYNRSETLDVGGRDVRVLCPGDQLLQVCYHFHHHMGFFKGLIDVAAWWDRFGDRPEVLREVFERASEHGVLRIVHWPLDVLERISGGEIWRGDRPVNLASLYGAWTTRCVSGVLGEGVDVKLLDFKTFGVSQEEVLAWRLLGLMLVDGGWSKAATVVFRSPEMMRMERGGERVQMEDWRRWGQRILSGGERRK